MHVVDSALEAATSHSAQNILRPIANESRVSDEAWLTDRNDPNLFLPTAGLSGHRC